MKTGLWVHLGVVWDVTINGKETDYFGTEKYNVTVHPDNGDPDFDTSADMDQVFFKKGDASTALRCDYRTRMYELKIEIEELDKQFNEEYQKIDKNKGLDW